ncbi:uncharacterized protein TRUGW13939_03389 [Talaromyces rugulosus]|uniref:Pentacotripeptide-repeat region of PRORP domain-containing protein n=1 Tax=Talaromyces rugulosus TaxID=121627 RepID=A0A7H8QQX4_TALRU|nr:uncharacterized protein TRUGW13939_03389 [Talaromyces rugulosus]QKX56288.1 hypothetical protein TRUGW13939_03389 [Talaromyces rugulosus]
MSTGAAQPRMKTDEEAEEPSTNDPPPSHADDTREYSTTIEERDNEAGAHQYDMDHDPFIEPQEDEDCEDNWDSDGNPGPYPRYRPRNRVSILEYIKKTRAVDLVTAEMFQQEDGTPEDPDDPRRHSVNIITFLAALHDKSKSNQYVFTCYKKLPDVGVAYLSRMERKILLRRFAKPLDRRRSHARYYLQLVHDMIDAELPMNRWHWTNAIYFTAHKVPVLERRDLEDALYLWRKMESVGIVADGAIFELLFMIATKSNQFAVADSLLKEMKHRKLPLSRHGMVSKIYASGRRQDLNGVQDSFDEFVQAGGIVDTTVLNALLSALLQIGSEEVAQQLYSKMITAHTVSHLQTHPQHAFAPSTLTEFGGWRYSARRLGDIFKRYTRLRDQYEENPAQVQDLVPMSPDTRTFYIVFNHHCLRTGDLKQICQILRDMETVFLVPPQSFVYNSLFLGFSRHGASQGWTKERLLEVWVVFRRLLYESETRLSRLESDGVLIESLWENPLESIANTLLGPADDDQLLKRKAAPEMSLGGEIEGVEEEDIMKRFDNMGHYRRSSYLDDSTPRRLENTMLLSRGLNIAILKAFGAHLGSRGLIKIYTQIERIWKPWKRLPSDAHAVKNELDRQLTRIKERERHARFQNASHPSARNE